MKHKILLIAMLALSLHSNAQQDSTSNKASFYVGGILAFSNATGVQNGTVPMLETGICIKNFVFALDFGRTSSNFAKGHNDPYFLEFRFMPAVVKFSHVNHVPMKGFLVFGGGNVLGTKQFFIDYGGGILMSPWKMGDLSVQVGNADNNAYLSVGIFRVL